MESPLRFLFALAAACTIAACAADNATSPLTSSEAAAALASAPITFDQLNTSFVGSSSPDDGLVPMGMGDRREHHFGPGWGGFMGGGIGEAFIGGIAFGRGFGRGPFGDLRNSDQCAFSSTSNRVECTTETRRGLTVTRSYSFLDAAGAVQQAFDTATTNTVNVRTSVTGTVSHHESVTSTVNTSSDFTVVGLASGSTQRTVNGASSGSETTSGTRDDVSFTAERVAGDTTTALVIPIENARPTYPTAGTVVRSMRATITLAGQTPTTSSRREVITYDGSSTAKVVITQDGVTKSCKKPLPHGRLTCE